MALRRRFDQRPLVGAGPGFRRAFLIAFVFSFDEIVLASFVAGDATTFPLYLFSQLRFPTLLPQVIAVAVIVFFVSMFVVLLTEVGRRVIERRLRIDLTPVTGTPIE